MSGEVERVKNFIDLNIELKSRKDEYKFRRYYLMKYLKLNTGMSLTSIGGLFNKDHSTIVHALKRVDLLEPYEDYKHIVKDLEEEFPMDGQLSVQSLGYINPLNIGVGLYSLESFLNKKLGISNQK